MSCIYTQRHTHCLKYPLIPLNTVGKHRCKLQRQFFTATPDFCIRCSPGQSSHRLDKACKGLLRDAFVHSRFAALFWKRHPSVRGKPAFPLSSGWGTLSPGNKLSPSFPEDSSQFQIWGERRVSKPPLCRHPFSHLLPPLLLPQSLCSTVTLASLGLFSPQLC